MNNDNSRRVALVTGAAKRVGRAVALRLAEVGFDVAFTYLHSADETQSLVSEIEHTGARAMAIRADLADPAAAVDAIRSQFTGAFTRLDLLVNNASIYEADATSDAALAQMRRLWAVHVEAPLLLCRAFSSLLETAQGHVVNMVDLQAERPTAGYLAYCASKAGLWSLTLGLAREMAPRVTANGIAPGVVEWAKGMTGEERENYLRRVPLGRAGTPEDVAAAVVFLASGGSYVTGQILRLDGGRSIT